MAKIKKVFDKNPNAFPLRVTQRKGTAKRSASFRVGCGCCNEGLVIFPSSDHPHDNTIEINGVMGTIHQWQQIFGPLLNMEAKADK